MRENNKKINVLYVCHDRSHMGGAVRSLINLIDAVKEYVYPIVLLDKRESDEIFNFLISKGIECIAVPFEWNVRPQKLSLMSIVKYIPKLFKIEYINHRCLNIVCNELKERNIQIVHSNGSVFTIGYSLAKKIRAKHVWHIREFQNIDFGLAPFFGWNNLKKKIYNSDAVIAITQAIYKHWGLENAKNAYYIWNAVRSQKEVECIYPKEKYFIFCSVHLSDNKGTDFAIDAFGKSVLAPHGYKLILIGDCDSNYKKKLNQIITKYHIENNIEFVGYCTNIKPYFLHATAFLMCSLNEGMGRVTVEAMFYGCPVIARNTGGTIEFIQHGINGFLFNNNSECVQIMKDITDKSSNLSAIINKACDTAYNCFSEEAYRQKILKIYHAILNNKVIHDINNL